MAAMKKDDEKAKETHDAFVKLVANYMRDEFGISDKVNFPVEVFDIIAEFSKLDEKVEARLEKAFKRGLDKHGLSKHFEAFKKEKTPVVGWGAYLKSDQYKKSLANLSK